MAESDPSVLYTLTGILEQAGFCVEGVSKFDSARQRLRKSEFDALMTEFTLDRDELGLELAREAKKLDHPPPVIICTAHPTVERLRAAHALRVDYIAFKPLDIAEIRDALHRLIARHNDALCSV